MRKNELHYLQISLASSKKKLQRAINGSLIDEPSRCIIALDYEKCMHEAKIVVAQTTLDVNYDVECQVIRALVL